MHGYRGQNPYPFSPPVRKTRSRWVSVLIAVGAMFLLGGAGCVVWLFYLGVYGPETSVYTGNEVPTRFTETMKAVGSLEEDETVHYFYSDALTDIRDGFYFVSDKKLVIYKEGAGPSPLTIVRFDQIAELDIYRNESFFIDSEITLTLVDGRPISFPVSSESDGDQRFFDTLQVNVERLRYPE